MAKRFILISMIAMIFLINAPPVYADGVPGAVYVDTGYTGSEDGTQAHPYNTLQEGIAFAQSQPGGAWLYVKQPDGSWMRDRYVPPIVSAPTGTPLADVALYSLLVVLALGLILIGWQFWRLSQKLRR